MRTICATIAFACCFSTATGTRADMGKHEVGFDAHIPSPAVLDLVRNSGAKWIRIDNTWMDQGDPCSANITFQPVLDDVVTNANARNLKTYMTLAYTPPCASLGNTDDRQQNDVPDAGLWANFVRQAVGRYRSMGVTYFGLWNEPNLGGFFEGDNATYVEQIAKPGIQAVRQGCLDAGYNDCKVLGPELASIGAFDKYLEGTLKGIMKAGLMYDVLSHHIYQPPSRWIWEGQNFTQILESRRFPWDPYSVVEVLKRCGLAPNYVPQIEVWITETGEAEQPWNDQSGFESQRKKYMDVLDIEAGRSWLTNVFFYEITDAVGTPMDGYGATRLMDDGTYYLKPSYLDLQQRLATDPAFWP
jgi:hypothetical protein